MNESKTLDELIDLRWQLRQARQYKQSDDLRDTLDQNLIFCFDHKDYQEVLYLTDAYFRRMPDSFKTKRQYVEYRMRLDRHAESNFNAWLYSMGKSMQPTGGYTFVVKDDFYNDLIFPSTP